VSITLTLLGQAIAFTLFVGFCMKFVWPPLMAILRERQKKISDGLEAAEKAQDDLLQAKEKVGVLVAEGKKQAQTILANAHKQADQIVEDARQNAETEKQRILTSAQQEIAQGISEARAGLYREIGSLVSQGVNKILDKEVDMSSHKSILASLNKHSQGVKPN